MTLGAAATTGAPQPSGTAAEEGGRMPIVLPRHPRLEGLIGVKAVKQSDSPPEADRGNVLDTLAAAFSAAPGIAAGTAGNAAGPATGAGPASAAGAASGEVGAAAARRDLDDVSSDGEDDDDDGDSSGSDLGPPPPRSQPPQPPQQRHADAPAPKPQLQSLSARAWLQADPAAAAPAAAPVAPAERAISDGEREDGQCNDDDDDAADNDEDLGDDAGGVRGRSEVAGRNGPAHLRCYRCNKSIPGLRSRKTDSGFVLHNLRLCGGMTCFKPIRRIMGTKNAACRLDSFHHFERFYKDRLEKYVTDDQLIGARDAQGKEDVALCLHALQRGEPLPPPSKKMERTLRRLDAWKGAAGSGNASGGDDESESESDKEGDASDAGAAGATRRESDPGDCSHIVAFTHLRTIPRTGEESYRVQFTGEDTSALQFWTRSELNIPQAEWDQHVARYRESPMYKKSIDFKRRSSALREQLRRNERAAAEQLEDPHSRGSDSSKGDDASAGAAGPSRKRTRATRPSERRAGATATEGARAQSPPAASAPGGGIGRDRGRRHADATGNEPARPAGRPRQVAEEHEDEGAWAARQEARQALRDVPAPRAAAAAAAADPSSGIASQDVRNNIRDRLNRARKRMQKGASDRTVTIMKDLAAFIEVERGGGIQEGAATRLRDCVAQVINDVREGDEDAIDEVEELLEKL